MFNFYFYLLCVLRIYCKADEVYIDIELKYCKIFHSFFFKVIFKTLLKYHKLKTISQNIFAFQELGSFVHIKAFFNFTVKRGSKTS